ncbi:MAG: hypothetical protein ACLGGV_01280 [Bacteroidia bacterium]
MKKIIYSVLAVFTMFSCTPPMYIPNTTNTPSLKYKGDMEASYSTGTNGHDLQTAYAVSDDYGVMLNLSLGNEKNDSSANFLKHNFFEGGFGRTFILNKDSDKETKSMFTVFSGFGYGSTKGLVNFSNIFDIDLNYTNDIEGSLFRVFIQPSIGLSSDNIDFFFTLRTSYVNVYKLETNMEADWQGSYVSDEDYNKYLELINRKPYNIFVEPTITLKVGGTVKGFFQLGASFGTTPNIETTFRQRPIIALIGLQVDLNRLQSF